MMNTVRKFYEEGAKWFVWDDENRMYVNDLSEGRQEVRLVPVGDVWCNRERDAIESAKRINLDRPRYKSATGYVYVGRSPVSDGYEYHLYVEVWA